MEGAAQTSDGAGLNRLFASMGRAKATDLHIKAGRPPLMRVHGEIRAVDSPPLTPEQARDLVYGILNQEQVQTFERTGNIDFAHDLPQVGRFRVNVFRQRGAVSMAARAVKGKIPDFAALNLPPVMSTIAAYEQGLVIVAGITGSGKSTTLAAMIDFINQRRACHVLCIEDPIEYLHSDKKAFVNQREVGIDVTDFQIALRNAVREDPDVILIGEMRDAETFQVGLTAAETGHLVFGTLHSSSAASTFGRILDLFPPDRHDQIRQSLRFNLKAIVCQMLLPSAKKEVGLVPMVEVMLATPVIQKLIKERKDDRIPDAVRGGRREGMQDFNRSLLDLVGRGLVTKETALTASPNPDALQMNFQGIFLGDEERILE